MHADNLLRACEVVERGAVTEALRSVLFVEGRLRAFNGLLEYQAPSGLAQNEHFAVAEAKLSAALRACGPELTLDATDAFLRLKNGPLTVRVRKLPSAAQFSYEPIVLSPTSVNQKVAGLLDAIRVVRDFVSSDASRPWSVAVLIKDGYVWATNNLALVRSPIDLPLPEMRIPGPAVDFICNLPDIEYYDIDDRDRLVFAWGEHLVRCPQTSAQWPDVAKFFADFPAVLAEVPAEMRVASKTVEKFAERFISLSAQSVASKTEALETEYEVAFDKGVGIYSARLLALVLAHATHADFSFYPKPIYFRGKSIEGIATGVTQV